VAEQTQTRRDRRREQTRDAMKTAARDLISEKGVAGLRIQEITARADVALGSFYNHFETKEDLVEAIVADSLGSIAEALATPASEDQDPAELVALAIRSFVGLAYDDPDFARLVVHLNHADTLFVTAVHPPARRAVELGMASGRFEVADLEVAVTGIVGGALALMRAIIDDRVGAGADAEYARTALRALGVPAKQAERLTRG
jgi:AcrR family transcriptional regulator